MAKKKFGLDLDGLEEFAKRLENINVSVQETAEEALSETHAHVTRKVEAAVAGSKYNFQRTGKTKSTLQKKPNITWEGSTATVRVGFDISNGGLPSIFLMYGTPSITPDKTLYNAFYGGKTKKEIKDIQQSVFINKLIEGGG